MGRIADMVVAVEDLSTVEFIMVPANSPPQSSRTRSEGGGTPTSIPHNIPTPCVSGNRFVIKFDFTKLFLSLEFHLLFTILNLNFKLKTSITSF